MLIVVAVDADKVMALLERDIYSTSGVWDLDATQIIPVCFCLYTFFDLYFDNNCIGCLVYYLVGFADWCVVQIGCQDWVVRWVGL